jgi:hypothetical protein
MKSTVLDGVGTNPFMRVSYQTRPVADQLDQVFSRDDLAAPDRRVEIQPGPPKLTTAEIVATMIPLSLNGHCQGDKPGRTSR